MRLKTAVAIGATLLAHQTLPATAMAEGQPVSLLLTCTGTEPHSKITGTTTTVVTRPGVDPGPMFPDAHRRAVIAGTATTSTDQTPVFTSVDVPARISVAIEGDKIRVHASDGTGPTFKKSADGWYDLTDVSITETGFSGRTTYGLFGKNRLSIDRRTGDVSFGDFSGVCEKASNAPSERKF